VSKIVPTADRAKATVQVKVGFKEYDRRVLPEMSAKVLFFRDSANPESTIEKPVLVIPQSALARRNGKEVVFQVEDNTAKELEVVTGQRFENYIEIVEGLQEGDQIITNLGDQIIDGKTLTII